MDQRGHLFVVHGKIESVVHDVAILPTDGGLNFEPHWAGLLPQPPRDPQDWSRRLYGRLEGAQTPTWAISVAGWTPSQYSNVLDRLRAVLEAIAADGVAEPCRGDALPLVAMPVIGIGRGGHGHDRGAVLRELTDLLVRLAAELSLDIALVTPAPAVYAAAQYACKNRPSVLPSRLEHTARELGEQARAGGLALLVGAGVSMGAGLPSWTELLDHLAQKADLPDFLRSTRDLGPTDQAELIQKHSAGQLGSWVAGRIESVDRAALTHCLLAALDVREVVTTNYDLLYEKAVRATGRRIESVMPWKSAQGADRWVLKLHGDVNHADKIVLTRRHMVRYDALNRPSGAMLQSLLLTKRLLVVGTSMTDDNVLRLAHEVQAYRDEHAPGTRSTFGTVLDAGGDAIRRQLWDGELDWISLPEQGVGSGPRAAELLLDRIAFHASRTSPWLLDPRFGGLLDDRTDRELADQVRALYDRLPRREGTKWTPLIDRLRQLGVDPQDP